MSRMLQFPLLLIAWSLAGCVDHYDWEHSCRWYELRPHPTDQAVAQFQAQFPDMPVTTTRPGSWDKIELGMTRAMVRALVGERLVPRDRYVAVLRQDQTLFTDEWNVRLYFDVRQLPDDDLLQAIIVRQTGIRLMQSTDWP